MGIPSVSIGMLILIFIIVIGVMIAVILIFRSNIPKQQDLDIYGWDNPPLGTCNIYQFSGTFDSGVYTKPNPSYNVLDASLINTSYSSNLTCLDFDLLDSTSVTHICSNAGTGPNASKLECFTQTGTTVPYNSKETLFIDCTLPQCNGNLSIMSLGYRPDVTYCLDNTLGMSECDPSQSEQQWRFTRKSSDSATVSSDQTGNLMQIYDRDTNKCLTLTPVSPLNVSYDTTFITGCTKTGTLSSAYNLALDVCGQDGNFQDSFSWYILPTENNQPTQLIFVGNGTGTSTDIPQSMTAARTFLQNNPTLIYTESGGTGSIYPVSLNLLPLNQSDTDSVCINMMSTYQPFTLQDSLTFYNGFAKQPSCFSVDNTTFGVTTDCLTTDAF